MAILKITEFKPKSALKGAHRKDKGYIGSLVAIDKKGGTIAEARFYQPGSTMYAGLWIYIHKEYNEHYASGSAQASGGGYEKKSSALDDAMRAAGIKITPFGGTGASKDAMEVLGKYVAKTKFLTVIETYP